MTPHISAEKGDFAKVCLLPGDPLRARYVAEKFLDGARLVTSVRNMEGYTGSYRGTPISVMGTGMGIPSASIYATELINVYGVEVLIRIGSAGGIQPDVVLRDVVIAVGASTDSNVNRTRFEGHDFAALADFEITRTLAEVAGTRGVRARIGNVLSSDLFYRPNLSFFDTARRMGILAVEMEAAGIFGVAAEHGARAAAAMTITDVLGSEVELTAEEREQSLDDMISLTLEAAVRI